MTEEKNSSRKINKNLGGTPCLFKILSQFFFEFLTFDSWNSFSGTKNDVYRRRLLISSIYRVRKWNIKCTPFSSTSRPRTSHSPGPFKIDESSNTLWFYLSFISFSQSDPIVKK